MIFKPLKMTLCRFATRFVVNNKCEFTLLQTYISWLVHLFHIEIYFDLTIAGSVLFRVICISKKNCFYPNSPLFLFLRKMWTISICVFYIFFICFFCVIFWLPVKRSSVRLRYSPQNTPDYQLCIIRWKKIIGYLKTIFEMVFLF